MYDDALIINKQQNTHGHSVINHWLAVCGRIVYAREVHMPLCNPVNSIWRLPTSNCRICFFSPKLYRINSTFPNKVTLHVQRRYNTPTYQTIHDSSDGPCSSKNLFRTIFFHCQTIKAHYFCFLLKNNPGINNIYI